jgi:hypothetical protein
MEINGGIAKCSWGKENIDITSGGSSTGQPSSVVSSMGGAASLYAGSNATNSAAATAAALAAAQNANSLQAASQLTGANSAWTTAATSNPNWAAAAANYQWAAAAGYPQSTMNYWQSYPGYQNAMMQQTWGVMPTAGTGTPSAGAGATAPYQMGQYQQGTNGKS